MSRVVVSVFPSQGAFKGKSIRSKVLMSPALKYLELLLKLFDKFRNESARVLRRLFSLRGLSHEEVEQVFT
jgi:hypothetical protein